MEVTDSTRTRNSSTPSRFIAKQQAASNSSNNPNDRRELDPLSRSLGFFSLGLGLAQLLVPADVARIAGADPNPRTLRLMRLLGLRELTSGVGILMGKQSQPWLRARVAGDVMDLALLAKLGADGSTDRTKTAAAVLAVAGVTALDVIAARRGGSSAGDDSDGDAIRQPAPMQPGTTTVRRAVTISRSPDEVAAFWQRHTTKEDALDEHVRFVPAPGGRGTEVHLQRTYERPGPMARMIARIRHHDPEQIAFDELFALKQIIETGDIVISDAWLNGPSAPRAAQPA